MPVSREPRRRRRVIPWAIVSGLRTRDLGRKEPRDRFRRVYTTGHTPRVARGVNMSDRGDPFFQADPGAGETAARQRRAV